MGAKKTAGLTLTGLLALCGIGKIAYDIDHTQKEDDKKAAAEAARVHHARITLGAPVEPNGTMLIKSWRTLTIDNMPPPNVAGSVVTVKMDRSRCEPLAILQVNLNDAQLTLSRCTFPRGSTGVLTWIDPPPPK